MLICPLLVGACRHAENASTDGLKEDTIPVKLQPLSQQVSGQQIKTSGIFTTDNEAILSFKNGGIIQHIYVKEGDAVKAGQLLATLNPTEIDAGAQQAKLAEEKAERDYLRAKDLYEDSVATLEQMQNAETAWKVARSQLRSAQYNQSQTAIKATEAGYVLKRLANDGQVIGPGTPVIQMNRMDKNGWQLRVGVSDAQWSAISLGDSATVSVDVLGKDIPAFVYKKSEGIDPSSGVFTVMLKLSASTPLQKIGTGMFAQATIKTKKNASHWQIPYDALLDGDAGKAFVFVTNDGKTAKRVAVQVDAVQPQGVLISSGLENAQSLIVSGSAYLDDGSPIRIVK